MVHKEATNVDNSNIPELLRLAEEVKDTKEPKILRRDGEELAVLVPLAYRPLVRRGSRRTKTKADLEAFRAAAGSWKDVDTDKLIADIYESRKLSARPPVELRNTWLTVTG